MRMAPDAPLSQAVAKAWGAWTDLNTNSVTQPPCRFSDKNAKP